MRTINFSRHNVVLCTEDCSSLDIPDAMSCRAHYQVFRVRGNTQARLIRIEREVRGTWVTDRLPTLERQALEAHIERLFDEDDAEDARNVREVASGYV
jgi:hypothetical protein